MFLVLSQGFVLFAATLNVVAYSATHSQGRLKVRLRYSHSIEITLYVVREIRSKSILHGANALPAFEVPLLSTY